MNQCCRYLFSLLSLMVILSGCNSLSVETTIHKDGSYTRNLKFVVGKEPMGGAPNLENVFAPLGKKDWSIATKTKDDSLIVEASRKFAKNTVSKGDIAIYKKVEVKRRGPGADNEKKKPLVLLTNTVTVKELAPGKFEYREVLSWKGKREKVDWATGKTEADRKKLEGCLPEKIASKANAKKLAQHMASTMNQILFGPGTPMLPQFLMQTELALRKMMIRLGNETVDWLEREFGDKLSDSERIDAVRKILKESGLQERLEDQKAKSQPKGPGGAKKKEDKDETDLVPMSFAVSVPGKVLESNGEVDRFTGKVYWGVYPQAAAYKDVVLRVVYTTK
jgi:hypothetical protein